MDELNSPVRQPSLLEEELFPAPFSQYSPEIIYEDYHVGGEGLVATECKDVEQLHETSSRVLKKGDRANVNCVGDLYPEVTLKEENDMRRLRSNNRGKIDDLSCPEISPDVVPDTVLQSLIDQFGEEISPAEVSRSVNCFVPVIRVEDDSSISVLVNTIKPENARLMANRTRLSAFRLKSKAVSRRPWRPISIAPPPIKLDDLNLCCEVCFKQFRTERAFHNHRKLVKSTSDTTCSSCDIDLKRPNCLRFHRRQVHDEEDTVADNTVTFKTIIDSSRVCEICNKVFTRISSLIYHRRRSHHLGNSVERKHKCRRCHKSFLQQSHLITHKKGHQLRIQMGEEDPGSEDDLDFNGRKQCPVCDICGKMFTRATGLIYHKRQVHHIGEEVARKFKCKLCNKGFLKKSHLLLHGQSHSGERLFPCRFCQRSFRGSSGRRQHEDKVHCANGNDITPEEIEKNRAAAAETQNHDETVDPLSITRSKHQKGVTRSFPCAFCTKVFFRPSAKRVHERRHTGEKPYLCVVCGNTYKSSVALKEHEKTAHTHTLDLLCTICGAGFGRQMSLKYHILSKHSEKKFTCDNEGCGRSFVQRAKLIRHQRIHSLGLHQCNFCNRALESNELLERHVMIHEMRKMKLAGVEGIVVPKNLSKSKTKPPPKPRKERKTPAPIRKLQCTYCEKRFPYQNELDKHIKAVHLNDRQYQCSESGCPRAYISEYKLQNHLRKAHGYVIENNLLADVECDLCGKVVQGVARLAIHKRSRHSDATQKLPNPTPTSFGQMHPVRNHSIVPRPSWSVSVVREDETLNPVSVIPPNARALSVTLTSQVVPSRRTSRNSVVGATEQEPQTYTLPSTVYGTAPQHDQVTFVSFTPMYNTAAPLSVQNFPYSSTSLAVPLPQCQEDFEFQNGSNFWQAHQHPRTTVLNQPIIYRAVTPQNHSQTVPPFREVLGSSDYSDLIRIPVPEEHRNQVEELDNNAEDVVLETGDERDGDLQNSNNSGRVSKKQMDSDTSIHLRRNSSKRRKPSVKKELPCPVCNKVFGTNQHLRTHLATHDKRESENKYEFKCEVCGKTFARQYYLTVHSVIHDPSMKPFKCSVSGCEEAFRAPSEFRKHKCHHRVRTERKYRCKICKAEKATSRELHTHVIEAHTEQMHACQHPSCSFICPTASRLKRHSDQHRDKGERLRPYKCQLCECSYIRGDNLQQHLDTSHGGSFTAVTNPNVNAFTCPICSKQFEFDWKVKSHIRKTHGRKKKTSYASNKPLFYFCEDCDWSFPSSAALRLHVKSHKGDPIPCLKPPCDKKYFYVRTLENHVRTQHEYTPQIEQLLTELRIKYPSVPEPIEEKRSNRRRKAYNVTKNVFEEEEDEIFPGVVYAKKAVVHQKTRRKYSDSDSSIEYY